MVEIKNIYGAVIYKSSVASETKQAVIEAVTQKADLSGADLRGAYLSGKKIHDICVFTGLYRYQVWAVFFQDGTRWIRMGCLFKSLEEWTRIGIRESNTSEYPNDGSAKCEERVRAFEFARVAALALVAPEAA